MDCQLDKLCSKCDPATPEGGGRYLLWTPDLGACVGCEGREKHGRVGNLGQ